MSFNKNNFIPINENAFVLHNFLSEEEADLLFKKAFNSSFTENDHPAQQIAYIPDKYVHEKISSILDNKIFCSNLGIFNTKPGMSWEEHTDLDYHTKPRYKKLYGGIIYLNDFLGGDLFYSESNTIYHPLKGDIVLHNANTKHGVSKLLSDYRYTINFYIWKNNVV
jgi:hypothetical protein